MYKHPEYTCESVKIIIFCELSSVWGEKKKKVFWQQLIHVLVASPSVILVATAAAPVIMMPAAAPAIIVTAAAPFVLMVIVVPALIVLLMTAGSFFWVSLISAAAVHLGGIVTIGGIIVLPGAAFSRMSRRLLPLKRLWKGAVYLLKLLHMELPHHVVHHDMLLQVVWRREGPLHLGRRGVWRWAELDGRPLAMGVRCVGRTCILWVPRTVAMTAAWSELHMQSSPEQRGSIQKLHGIRHRHFMFIQGETKCFLLPIWVFGDFCPDERSCL